MAHTYHQIYIQTVFAVKYREALIAEAWQSDLFAVIGNLINETGCQTLIVNGVADHVHCLLGLRPAVAIADLMRSVKAKSAKWVNEQGLTTGGGLLGPMFRWQEGYGAFSYTHSHVDQVRRYIERQAEHHQYQTFTDEYLSILNNLGIPFEEQYLFAALE
jgi:putative transposase